MAISVAQIGLAVAIAGVLGAGAAAAIAWLHNTSAPKLRASCSFTTQTDGVDKVTLVNLGSEPVIADHWVLVWRRRKLLGVVETIEAEGDLSPYVGRIECRAFKVLAFADDRRLRWGAGQVHRGKLYLRVRMPGRRRPALVFVYDPAR
jgi:hypothetical protein